MQTATKLDYANRLVAFPVKAASRVQSVDVRAQFERLLIFVLCTLWAIGVVLWTLISLVGVGHSGGAPGTLALDAASFPTSLPTLQSATIFAVRLILGL